MQVLKMIVVFLFVVSKKMRVAGEMYRSDKNSSRLYLPQNVDSGYSSIKMLAVWRYF